METKKSGILSKFSEWVARNRERIDALIRKQLEPREEYTDWAFCMTAPPEFLDWLPVLDLIHRLGRRHYILAITSKRLLRIETKAMSIAQPKKIDSIPLSDISSIKAKHGLLSSCLVVTVNGQKTVYKELESDTATTFEAEFERLVGA